MKIVYSCSKCGAQFPKWNGKCLDCGAWGTLDKETFIEDERKSKTEDLKDVKVDFIDLSKIKNEEFKKIKTGLIYFDKVIGGGSYYANFHRQPSCCNFSWLPKYHRINIT